MNTLRQSSSIPLRKFYAKSSNNLSSGIKNTANFAWQYWRRANNSNANGNYVAVCWNQLRPYHIDTANSENDERGTTYSPNSIRPYYGGASLLSSYTYNTATHLPTSLLDTYYMAILSRSMSSMKSNSTTNNFSTIGVIMPHSTLSNHDNNKMDNNNNKQQNSDLTPLVSSDSSLPASQKAKILFKKYGAVFVGTYFGVYFGTLGTFFVALDFGLLDPDFLSQVFKVSRNMACETADIIGPTGTGASMNEAANAYAEEVMAEAAEEISKEKRSLVDIISGYLYSWEWTQKYVEKLGENPHLTNLAVAWFMVKFTEPVRLAAAVLLTPKVAKVLGRKGAKVDKEKGEKKMKMDAKIDSKNG